MDDLIKELRHANSWCSDQWATVEAAAAEIERLRSQNRELVTELKIRDGVISDLQNRPVAPEGYAVVPLDPTPAMVAAVADVPTIAASVWRDMLAAAPTIRG